MIRAAILWLHLVVGAGVVLEGLWHVLPWRSDLNPYRPRLGSADRSRLGVGVALLLVVVLQLFFLEYNWLPDVALWPAVLLLDVMAVVLQLRRLELAEDAATRARGI